MRGGRGGGGRGGRGGRWFGKPSMTHDLIRDNLEDLGLDQYAAVDDKKPPELYPATKLPGIPPLFDEDVSTTHKTMYLLHRFRASQDYMGSLTDKNVKGPDFEFAEWSAYLPHELLTPAAAATAAAGKKRKRDALNLQKLEQAESSGGALRRESSLVAGEDDEEKEDEDADAGDEDAEEEADYEDDDYMADHYASDNDMGDDDGGGDEAVF